MKPSSPRKTLHICSNSCPHQTSSESRWLRSNQGGLIPLKVCPDSPNLNGKSRVCTMIQATRPRRRGGASNMQPVGDERVKSTGASQLGFRRLLPAALFGRVDSKGHSRFVLRILIILSHRSPKQRGLQPPLRAREGRKGPPLQPRSSQTARVPSLLFASVGSHGWRFSNRGLSPGVAHALC